VYDFLMEHPFDLLRPEYEQLLATVQVTRPDAAVRAANEIDRHLQSYIVDEKDYRHPAGVDRPD
jgi:hypothetical protein